MKLTTGSLAAAILFLFGTFAASAQPVSITGTVLSSDGTGPVIGAAVFEEGVQGNGTITDIDGVFTISVESGAKLTISSVGYKTITILSCLGLFIVSLLAGMVLGIFAGVPLLGWLFRLAARLVQFALFAVGVMCFVLLTSSGKAVELPVVGGIHILD